MYTDCLIEEYLKLTAEGRARLQLVQREKEIRNQTGEDAMLLMHAAGLRDELNLEIPTLISDLKNGETSDFLSLQNSHGSVTRNARGFRVESTLYSHPLSIHIQKPFYASIVISAIKAENEELIMSKHHLDIFADLGRLLDRLSKELDADCRIIARGMITAPVKMKPNNWAASDHYPQEIEAQQFPELVGKAGSMEDLLKTEFNGFPTYR